MSLHGRVKKLERRYPVATERAIFRIVHEDGTVSETAAPRGVKESLTLVIDYGDGQEEIEE